jgi:hypothetical protein
VDKSGLKDNIAAKTYLFLAWFGTVQPEYGKNNTVLPSGWTNEFMAMWNDKDGHYKLLKDGGEALRTLLEFCEVATDDSPARTKKPRKPTRDGSSGGTTSGSTIRHMVCPKCESRSVRYRSPLQELWTEIPTVGGFSLETVGNDRSLASS